MKPPEVLTRDRLLGTYEVKPTLARLKTTLLGTGGSLLFSAFVLFGLISTQANADGMYGVAPDLKAASNHLHCSPGAYRVQERTLQRCWRSDCCCKHDCNDSSLQTDRPMCILHFPVLKITKASQKAMRGIMPIDALML